MVNPLLPFLAGVGVYMLESKVSMVFPAWYQLCYVLGPVTTSQHDVKAYILTSDPENVSAILTVFVIS